MNQKRREAVAAFKVEAAFDRRLKIRGATVGDLKAQMTGFNNVTKSHEKDLSAIQKAYKKLEPVLKKMKDPDFINEAVATLRSANKQLNEVHLPLDMALDYIERSVAAELPTWKKGRRFE